VLCLIAVPLSLGKNPFAVKINKLISDDDDNLKLSQQHYTVYSLVTILASVVKASTELHTNMAH
jgi:hypothetical protein